MPRNSKSYCSGVTIGEFSDRDILCNVIAPDRPFFSVWEPCETLIVLGRSNVAADEVYMHRAQQSSIRVLRRMGGGGAVVLSKGMLILTFSTMSNVLVNPSDVFNTVNMKIMSVLSSYGVRELSLMGISDICLNSKKILGSSLYLPQGGIVYTASLLFNCELSDIEKYLKFPTRYPQYRAERTHSEFLTTLYKEGYTMPAESLAQSLMKSFCDMSKPALSIIEIYTRNPI
ncbi:MAG: hypothetical protein H7844_03420 [Nitrospirae bacterium YQR-1]